MHKRRNTSQSRQTLVRGVLLVALALLLYGIVPQISGLRDSWPLLLHARLAPLLLGLVLLTGTFAASAAIYQFLAFYRLRFWPTLAVQLAGGLAGKLLPAGLGNLGINITYLHRAQHSLPQAAAVAGVNNTVGFAGYLLDACLAALFLGFQLPHVHLPGKVIVIVGLSVVVLGSVALGIWHARLAAWLKQTGRALLVGVRAYHQHPGRLVGALLVAMLMPLLFAGIIMCCAHALDIHLSALAAFAVFSAGMAVATVTPTPGGIVGAEAGITATLVAYGFAANDALLIALLYRFITYWLPMVPGAVALGVVQKRYLSRSTI